jgi:hypothetical protein
LLEYDAKFHQEFSRLTQSETITSIADFQKYLKKERLDNITVIYFDRDQTDLDVATRLLQHQTQHPILRVESDELATKLRLSPGKFYLYYKPSVLLDESRNLVMSDINFNIETIQALEGSCRNELTVNSFQA